MFVYLINHVWIRRLRVNKWIHKFNPKPLTASPGSSVNVKPRAIRSIFNTGNMFFALHRSVWYTEMSFCQFACPANPQRPFFLVISLITRKQLRFISFTKKIVDREHCRIAQNFKSVSWFLATLHAYHLTNRICKPIEIKCI